MTFFCILSSYAEKVDIEKAEKVARSYVRTVPQLKTRSNIQLNRTVFKELKPGNSLRASQEEAMYYVFSMDNNEGFVIVSADDIAVPVLGYSENGSYDDSNPNFSYWMEFLAQEIAWGIENKIPQSAEIKAKWERYLVDNANLLRSSTAIVYGPLLTTKWDQGAPYNNLCPKISGVPTYTGCVATAMAQIMKKWGYPNTGTGSHTDSNPNWLSSNLTANFGSTTYYWGNMVNTYSPTDLDPNDAIATLMYHCGISVDMNYGTGSSGASSSQVGYALATYFNYDQSIQHKMRNFYTGAEWDALLQNELRAGRPVLYSGQSESGASGHAFVCDGYNDDGTYHFNWGWSGFQDGDYRTTALNPNIGGSGSGSGRYNVDQDIVINIKPNAGGVPVPEIHITANTDITSTATSVDRSVAFTVDAPVYNAGFFNFTGDVCIALVSTSDEQIISVIGQNSINLDAGYYKNDPFNFLCSVPSSVASGNYRLMVFAKASGTSDWTVVTGTQGYIDAIPLTVKSIPPCYSYPSLPDFGNNISAPTGDNALNLNKSQVEKAEISNSFNLSASQSSNSVICADYNNPNNCFQSIGNYNYYRGQVQTFYVTKTDYYTFSPSSGFFTIFNSNIADCSNFVKSSGLAIETINSNSSSITYWTYSSINVSLNANTTYYLYSIAGGNLPASPWTISVSGAGSVVVESGIPYGTGYTYIAINQSDNTIKMQSATADFRTLPAGTYTVYGVPYSTSGTTNPANFVGKTLNEIEASDCVIPSATSIVLTVTSNEYTWNKNASSPDWTVKSNWVQNAVPLASSDVVIPSGATTYPILQASDNATVNTITFAPGAELGGQNFLKYNKAYVQLNFKDGTRNRWWMLSNPLQELYVGDLAFGLLPGMYISQYRDDGTGMNGWMPIPLSEKYNKKFEVGEDFQIWLNDADIQNSDKSKGLSNPYADGIITLPHFEDPKAADVYYSGPYFTPTRSVKAYRLADADVIRPLYFGWGVNKRLYFAATGNPFMGSISFQQLQIDNPGLFVGTYWIWIGPGEKDAPTPGSYSIYNLATGVTAGVTSTGDLSDAIAPMQSFIIESALGTTNPGTKFITYYISATGANANAVLKADRESDNILKIVASTPQSSIRAVIASRENGSMTLNNLDSRNFSTALNSLPIIYTLKPDETNGVVNVAANIVNEVKEDITIPLAVSTTYEGPITLTFTGMDTYNANIYLIDNEAPNKKEIEMTGQSRYEYTFNYVPPKVNGTVTANENRFFIRLSPANMTGIGSARPNNILIYSNSANTIQVTSGELLQQVTVFDLQGQKIYDNASINAYTHTLTGVVPGIYVVKAISKNGLKTTKIIVK